MENKTNNGMAIAAMVCGIVSVVLCWLSFVGLAAGIVGLVLSVMARKKVAPGQNGSGMVTAGLVCSIIGIVLGGIWTTCAMCTYCAAKKVVDAGLSSYYYY